MSRRRREVNLGIVNLNDFTFDENGKCKVKRRSGCLDIRKMAQARHINLHGIEYVRTSYTVNGDITPISALIERASCKLAVCH